MELSPEQLQEFIDLYRKHFDIDLSGPEAIQAASSLLRFYINAHIPFEINEDGDRISMPD